MDDAVVLGANSDRSLSVFAVPVQAVEDDGVYFIPELNKSYT
jgi:hypothetical protein